MDAWDKNNTFVYVILGDKASVALKSYRTENHETIAICSNENDKTVPSIQAEINEEVKDKLLDSKNEIRHDLGKNFNTIKLAHYYLTSQGILISELASKIAGIPQSNIKVFCYGEKEDFDVFHYTGNKAIIQLDFYENGEPKVYATSNIDISNFYFFKNPYSLSGMVIGSLEGNKDARVMLFLADHGTSQTFGTLTYLQIYSMFLHSKPKSLRIFNDSCQSQLLSDYIDMFDDLTDRLAVVGINSVQKLMKLLPIIYLAANYGKNFVDSFQYPEKAVELVQKMVVSLDFENLPHTIDKINSLPECARIIKYSDPAASIDDLLGIVKSKAIRETDTDKLLLVKTMTTLKESKIQTIGDYMILCSAFDAYKSFFEGPFSDDIFQLVFQQNTITLARSLYAAKTGLTIQQLLRNVDLILSQKISELSLITMCSLRRHNDLKVFTSAPRGGYGINFPSIRINNNTKAVIGSPAMSAFIKEVFMQFTDDEINLERIKQSCYYGHNTDTYIEYPSPFTPVEGTRISRAWIWLEINETGSAGASKDRLLTLKDHPDVDEIMHKIGYKELQLSRRDKARTRFREREGKPNYESDTFLNMVPRYDDRDKYDDYYDPEDVYESFDGHIHGKLSSSSESEDEFFDGHRILNDAKIAKIQKRISTTYVWDHDVFNVWLYLFTKRLKKRYGINFDPNANVQLDDPWFPNFIRAYNKICHFLPVNRIHRDYEALAPKIERLLLDHHMIVHQLTDLIANCFDDADRIVTPMHFPGQKTYMKRE